jgi:hypothetical protein
MKRSLLLVVGLLFTVGLEAENKSKTQLLETYQFRACDYWQTIPDNSSLYACNFYPQRVEVPTARDTARVINELERKISELEARVRTLEGAR